MTKRRWLNRDLVLQRAAGLADAAGDYEAVTLTALAKELHVRPPSLYNHVAGLDDLRHRLAVYALSRLRDVVRGAAAGQVGREALLAVAQAYRRFALDHPGLYPLTIRAAKPGDVEFEAAGQEIVHLLLLVLASYGLSGDDALHAVRGLRAVLHGFVSLEAVGGYELALDRAESYRRLVETYLDGLVRA